MVLLKCVAEGSRLRVKIISHGYLNQANCQFPRDIRREGCFYECDESAVSLIKMRNNYYYKIRKNSIRVLGDGVTSVEDYVAMQEKSDLPDQVFTDADNPDCSICLTEPKALIYVPCGHYISCNDCDKNLKKRTCPICRTSISHTITPDQMS